MRITLTAIACMALAACQPTFAPLAADDNIQTTAPQAKMPETPQKRAPWCDRHVYLCFSAFAAVVVGIVIWRKLWKGGGVVSSPTPDTTPLPKCTGHSPEWVGHTCTNN
jgi:hypothetical protein